MSLPSLMCPCQTAIRGTIATSHAISRYLERVDPAATYDQALAALDTPRIREMVAFGAREIILGTGHHAVVAGGVIVTVRPRPTISRRRAGRRHGEEPEE